MPATKQAAPELPKKLPMQFGHAIAQTDLLVDHAEPPAPTADGQPTAEDRSEPRKRYRIQISNENPFERYGVVWILGHKDGEVDLSYAKNGLSFWLEHGGSGRSADPDPCYHLGIVTDFEIDNGALWGWAEFADDEALSEIALRVKRDWESGQPTRRFISVGQKPIDYVLKTAQKLGEMSEQRWTLWQPREVSIVGVPAILNTGTQSASGEEFEVHNVTEHHEEEPNMPPTATPTPTPESPAPTPTPGVTVGEDALLERENQAEQIETLAETHRLDRAVGRDLARKVRMGKMTPSDAKADILNRISTHGVTRQPASETIDGLSKKDRKRYSYARAIRLQLEGHSSYDGLEGELHQELLRRRPENMAEHGGIFVPFDLRSDDEIFAAEARRLAQHTMASNAPGKGMELVGEARMPLIELLLAQSVLSRLGAQFNTGLSQPLSYPRVTSGPTVAFTGENPAADAAESDLVTGEIQSVGKPMIGGVTMSRALILGTNGQADAYATRLLSEGTALALDRAGFTGAGYGSQPTGLYFTPTVQTEAMGSVAPTYLKITSMIGKVADQNADLGTLGFFSTALLAAYLMGKEEFSNSGRPIWTGTVANGQIAGYRSIGSTQVSKVLGSGADEHGFGFGPWQQCHVNQWGGVEVLVDPFSGALRGLIKVRTYGAGDVVFLQPQAFVVATAAKPA